MKRSWDLTALAIVLMVIGSGMGLFGSLTWLTTLGLFGPLQTVPDIGLEATQVLTFATALLGIAALSAGIGIMLLKSWARILIIWQASLSIPLYLWSTSLGALAHRRFAESTATFLGDPFIQSQMLQGLVIQVAIAMMLVMTWNGLIIWFFLRPPVKVQFQNR